LILEVGDAVIQREMVLIGVVLIIASSPTHQQREAGVFVNHDGEIQAMRAALGDLDYLADNSNWGIGVYCRTVLLAKEYFSESCPLCAIILKCYLCYYIFPRPSNEILPEI
jgi:hypothetical protein